MESRNIVLLCLAACTQHSVSTARPWVEGVGRRTSLLFIAEQHSIVWRDHVLLSHSSVGGLLGCFHYCCVQVLAWTWMYAFISLGVYLGVELLGNMVTTFRF